MRSGLPQRLRAREAQRALEKWSETERLNALVSARAKPRLLNRLLRMYAQVLGVRAIPAIETAVLMDTHGVITPETLATITETLIAHEQLSEQTPLDSSPTLTMLKKIFERRLLPLSLREEALRLYVRHASQYLGINRSRVDAFQSYLLQNLVSDARTVRIVQKILDEYILTSDVHQKNRLFISFSKFLFAHKKIAMPSNPENSLELCFLIHFTIGRDAYEAYAAIRFSEEVLQWMKSRLIEHFNFGSVFENLVDYIIKYRLFILEGEMKLLQRVHEEIRQLRQGR